MSNGNGEDRVEVTEEQFEVITAMTGIEAVDFFRSKVGQYVMDRAQNEEERLIEELIAAALKSTDHAVVKIAMDINMHRMLPKYLNEAIQAGHNAEKNLDAMAAAQEDY